MKTMDEKKATIEAREAFLEGKGDEELYELLLSLPREATHPEMVVCVVWEGDRPVRVVHHPLCEILFRDHDEDDEDGYDRRAHFAYEVRYGAQFNL